jgi:hypothetical protein
VDAPTLALHGGNRQTHRVAWLQGVAAPLGGRAHLLLVRSQGRLAKDFQNFADTLLAFVMLASVQLVLRKPARG